MVSLLVAAAAMQRDRVISKVRNFLLMTFITYSLQIMEQILKNEKRPSDLKSKTFDFSLISLFQQQQFASIVKVRLIHCQVETFLSQTSGFGEAVETTCSMDTSEQHHHHHDWDFKKELSTIDFRFAQNLILNLLKAWFFRFAQNFIDIREREAKEKATGSQRSGRWEKNGFCLQWQKKLPMQNEDEDKKRRQKTKRQEKLDPVGSTVRYAMMKLCTGSV